MSGWTRRQNEHWAHSPHVGPVACYRLRGTVPSHQAERTSSVAAQERFPHTATGAGPAARVLPRKTFRSSPGKQEPTPASTNKTRWLSIPNVTAAMEWVLSFVARRQKRYLRLMI